MFIGLMAVGLMDLMDGLRSVSLWDDEDLKLSNLFMGERFSVSYVLEFVAFAQR